MLYTYALYFILYTYTLCLGQLLSIHINIHINIPYTYTIYITFILLI